jgi:hypothetical protein
LSATPSRPPTAAARHPGRRRAIAPLTLAVLAAACAGHDPARELEVRDLETYWSVDRVAGGEVFLAPSVRLRVRNKGSREVSYLDLRAAFRRSGESETWGSGSRFLATAKPLAPGAELPVILTSDAAYRCPTDDPASMFSSPGFVDAHVEVWARLPRSNFARLASAAVERRVGSRSVEEVTR